MAKKHQQNKQAHRAKINTEQKLSLELSKQRWAAAAKWQQGRVQVRAMANTAKLRQAFRRWANTATLNLPAISNTAKL